MAAGAPIDEARVQQLIDAMQINMSTALRAEFKSTLDEVDRRLSNVQSAMSVDLRTEFDKSGADVVSRAWTVSPRRSTRS